MAIAIQVSVVHPNPCRTRLIHRAIAVVVDAIADLSGSRISRCRTIVAVIIVCDVPGGQCAGQEGRGRCAIAIAIAIQVVGGATHSARFIDGSVAVVVHTVAGLCGTRIHIGPNVVAVIAVEHVPRRWRAGLNGQAGVSVPISIKVPVVQADASRTLLVHCPITVVVQTIADLFTTGVGRRCRVITVFAVRDIPSR